MHEEVKTFLAGCMKVHNAQRGGGVIDIITSSHTQLWRGVIPISK